MMFCKKTLVNNKHFIQILDTTLWSISLQFPTVQTRTQPTYVTHSLNPDERGAVIYSFTEMGEEAPITNQSICSN